MAHSKLNLSEADCKEVAIPVPWGHLAAKTWGKDDGIPVLALHGWQDNAGSFDTLAPLLPSRLYLYCLDFAGHGLSSALPHGMFYNLWVHLYHVKIVVDHLKWERFSIIGHSMGAIVGILFAAIFPERLEKLVLLDVMKPFTVPAEFHTYRVKHFLKNLEKAEANLKKPPLIFTYERAKSRLVKGYSGSLDENAAKSLLKRGLIKKGEDEYCLTLDPRHSFLPNLFSDLTLDLIKAYTSQIQCAVLIFRCKDGMWAEPQHVYDEILSIYKEVTPQCEFVEVSGMHHAHLVDPQCVAPHICKFFSPIKAKL